VARTLLVLASLVVLGASVGVILAGCESEGAVSLGPPPGQTTAGPDVTGTLPASRSLQVWFVRHGRLAPELRAHAETQRVATAAVNALLAGPTRPERASGIATAIPPGTRLIGISIDGDVATVDLTSEFQAGGGSRALKLRLGQIVYTLTEFATVKAVRFELDGAPVKVFSGSGIVLDHPVSRSDYADLSPLGPQVRGAWRRLPAASIAGSAAPVAVWTGKEMLVLGRGALAAYDPTSNGWRGLGPAPVGKGVWTGSELIVWGSRAAAFAPSTNRWRQLPRPPVQTPPSFVVWTGHEVIGNGAAYEPENNRWRRIARIQGQGTWNGRELIAVNGSAVAAYDPATGSRRRLAPLPAPRQGANLVWDGQALLVVGGAARGDLPATGFAYDPATNRWRTLPPMESGRMGSAMVWTGKRLLLWGGATGRPGGLQVPPHGLAYDPKTDRWAPLPQAPLLGRLDPAAVWTGKALVVWGGATAGSKTPFADGAAFQPEKP
jgi:hypothetical protein